MMQLIQLEFSEGVLPECYLISNGTPLKGGRGDIRISGYQACGCGMESMHGGSEFTAEEGGEIILFTPWVSRGARDIDGNTQGQSGTAAVWYLP